MATRSTKDTMTVRVMTPAGMLWQGEAGAASSVNAEGPFDILPEHANFITIVEQKPITILGDEKHTYTFENAVISMVNNTLSIYGDITSDNDKSK